MQESKQNKLVLLSQMIENAERSIVAARQIMREFNVENRPQREMEASQIVEGAFDGEKMVSMDGKHYPVPANYASKSKLVEGDLLKLTITEDGSFVYKKISSVETRKVIGVVMRDSNDRYYVSAEGKKYNVLLASLTYFKAKEGDELILIVPKDRLSSWAAVESIISEADRAAAQPTPVPQVEMTPPQSGQSPQLAMEEETTDAPNAMAETPWENGAPETGALPMEETENPPVTGTINSLRAEADESQAAIADEWTPSVEEIKKEGAVADEEVQA